ETSHDAVFDRIIPDGEDNRNCGGRLFCCHGRTDAAGRSDQRHLTTNEIGRELRKAAILTFCPAILDSKVLTFAVAAFPEATLECGDDIGLVRRSAAEKPDHGHRRLLSARRERPRKRCAAEQRDELASSHVGHGGVLPPLCANEAHPGYHGVDG